MEENSFESKLQKLVQQADHNLQTGDGARERVWNNVKKQRPMPNWLWISSAASILLAIIWTLYQPKQSVPIATGTKMRKATEKKVEIAAEVKPMDLESRFRPSKAFKKQAKARRITPAVMDTKVAFLTPTETQYIKHLEPQVATLNTNPGAVALQPAKQEAEPSFTVQFKRGKPLVKEDESSFSTALKTFKLKRDTSYFANAEEKQPSIIKLSFKKEN